MQRVHMDREKLIGSDEGERNQRDLSLNRHVGAAGHHGLQLAGGGSASFRKENQRKTMFQRRDAAVEAGYKRAGALHGHRHLAGVVEIPADEGSLPEGLLRQNAELERQIGKENRRVHVTKVIGGVDRGLVLEEFFPA